MSGSLLSTSKVKEKNERKKGRKINRFKLKSSGNKRLKSERWWGERVRETRKREKCKENDTKFFHKEFESWSSYQTLRWAKLEIHRAIPDQAKHWLSILDSFHPGNESRDEIWYFDIFTSMSMRWKRKKEEREESFSGIRFHSLTRSKICVSVIPSRITTGEEAFLTGLILRS